MKSKACQSPSRLRKCQHQIGRDLVGVEAEVEVEIAVGSQHNKVNAKL